nr:hypothetical protein [Tanacetum cinerariifolium]
MEAGGKYHPPMLAPGNYVQWKSRIKRYIDTKPNHELIHYCLRNPPYKYTWADKAVLVAEGSSEITTKRYMENYKNVSPDIRDQLNAEAEAKAIEMLKQGESINVQYLETNFYWEFRKFTSRDVLTATITRMAKHQNEVNEIRVKRLVRTANLLVLVAQQQPVYHPQNHPTYYTQNSSTRSQQAATRNRGKAIVNSPPSIYDQKPSMVAEDDEMLKDKEIDKLMALISLSFKKIYKPTNNNLQTSSNTNRANQDNSPRINIGTGYDNQRIGNVVGARETVEQAYWRDDTDDESEDQELEAHYMYMVQIQEIQELKTVSYHKLYDILKYHQNEVNEIRAEKLARTANPLVLVAQQQPVYHPQNHHTQYTQNSYTRSQQAATKNKGKAIVNSPPPIYDQEPTMVDEDDEIGNQDNSLRISRGTGYDNQRIVNVARARENVGTTVVQKSRIQCYNCKEYGHVAKECQKLKREKDAAYHKDDTDDEPEDQELEAHYMYMAQIQEVNPDAANNSGPIFDSEPLQKVPNNDNYNVFVIESEHPEQSKSINDTYPIEQDEHNVIIDSLDMSHDREQVNQDDDDDDDLANERDLLASLIEKLKCEIDDSKNRNKFLETSKKVLVD